MTLAVPGEHMVSNALAAAAAGVTLGVPLDPCAEALSHAVVSHWRMETFTTPAGVRVVNDAYNANPESMAAALRAARWMAGEGHLIAVLGAMAELGPIAAREHERIGRAGGADPRGPTDRGRRRPRARSPTPVCARASSRTTWPATTTPTRCWTTCAGRRDPGDLVLFKGSRVAGLERLAEALR